MLVKTGLGSISFVAGCCWVNSVVQPPPNKIEREQPIRIERHVAPRAEQQPNI